jgi:hypothetical protein
VFGLPDCEEDEMSRYRRLVPRRQRRLIRLFDLGKPNWYVGSAESGGDTDYDFANDPSVRAEVDALVAELEATRARLSGGSLEQERRGMT